MRNDGLHNRWYHHRCITASSRYSVALPRKEVRRANWYHNRLYCWDWTLLKTLHNREHERDIWSYGSVRVKEMSLEDVLIKATGSLRSRLCSSELQMARDVLFQMYQIF